MDKKYISVDGTFGDERSSWERLAGSRGLRAQPMHVSISLRTAHVPEVGRRPCCLDETSAVIFSVASGLAPSAGCVQLSSGHNLIPQYF